VLLSLVLFAPLANAVQCAEYDYAGDHRKATPSVTFTNNTWVLSQRKGTPWRWWEPKKPSPYVASAVFKNTTFTLISDGAAPGQIMFLLRGHTNIGESTKWYWMQGKASCMGDTQIVIDSISLWQVK
jgi:hypothetical protein